MVESAVRRIDWELSTAMIIRGFSFSLEIDLTNGERSRKEIRKTAINLVVPKITFRYCGNSFFISLK
jgi:hypothetical protein